MGGLVIKRAYILAKLKRDYGPLASRIHSMFFLATPHRGADLAKTLSRFLTYGTRGNRPFVNDLRQQSALISSLNDEFPRYAHDLQLFSYFETLPMDFLGFKKTFIVDRESAVLDYPNERVGHLHANHRGVCKYTSTDDPNYQTIRNAIAANLEELRSQSMSVDKHLRRDQERVVKRFLRTEDSPEDDFISADGRRMSGSCEWLIRKENFQEWFDCGYNSSPVYCITGKPGTGKTIASGKVIAHLRERGARCAFYFFHHQNRATSDIAPFLLSMARQMALQDDDVLTHCLEVSETDENLTKTNYLTVWRKLFLEKILSSSLSSMHYWVVDALDECREESELVPFLLKAAELGGIRIFITSRNIFKSRQRLGTPRVEIITEDVPEQGSRADIALYLEANMDQLPALSERGRKEIVDQVLEKSQGCFLWVNLVLQELRKVHTSGDVKRILDEVPSDMNSLYARILASMSSAAHGKVLAKAILSWTVCAVRPLATVELGEALMLDLQDTIDDVEASIQSSCGHLVYVDANSLVQMVHLTARDYLLHPDTTSEFAVDEVQGHRRLLLTCLSYLQGNERKASRPGRPGNTKVTKEPSPFIKYASVSLHEHLRHLSWTDASLITPLAQFFASPNVLAWIEYLAEQSDLYRLIDTGKALGVFLNGVPESMLNEHRDIAMLNSWAVDLVRLVMQFGGNLGAFPASIYNLIAPFCPPTSAPRKQFGSAPRGITVRGVLQDSWGDCLSTIHNPDQQFSCIASSDRHFAYGCSSGKIMVFQHLLYHQTAMLDHQEPVRLLSFGQQGHMLVSASFKVIRVWNVATKSEAHQFDARQQCMAVAFADQGRQLVAAFKDHRLRIWSLTDSSLLAEVDWTVGMEEMMLKLYRRPITAAFSMDAQLLAVIYKGQDILIWDIEGDCMYDVYNRDSGSTGGFAGRPYGSAGVRCLEFGTGANRDLLAAAYTDGELVLFDTASGEVGKRGVAAFAHLLSRSPDGSKLATADPSGTIQIFQFDTLQLLYRINSIEPGIQDLAFSSDGQYLLDVRGSRGRIWGPTVLVGQSGVSGTVAGKPQEVNLQPVEDVVLITSIACPDAADVFFCGKEDGSVYVFDVETGLAISTLFSHARGVQITSLQYHSESKTITSVDTSGRLLIHCLSLQGKSTSAAKVLFDHRADFSVEQVLSRPDLDRILVCSAESDELWSISEGNCKMLNKIFYPQRQAYQWANNPLRADQLLLITRTTIHIYDWSSLQPLTSPDGILLSASIPAELSPIKPIFHNTLLAVPYTDPSRPLSNTRFLLFSTSDITPSATALSPVTAYPDLCSSAIHLVGQIGSGGAERLVFFRDGNWISTVDAAAAKEGRASFHFFFPADWMSTANHRDVMIEVTRRGDVLLVKRDEVAVVRRGLMRPEFVRTRGEEKGASRQATWGTGGIGVLRRS
jgi:WD40 repeat protein